MKIHMIRCIVVSSVMCFSGLTVPSAAAKDPFTLLRAVPDDVFLCVATRHNPERQFLSNYWDEVIGALKASGVGSDVMDMISPFLGDDQRMEIERLKERASQLIGMVNWEHLCGGEFVFAERMVMPAECCSDISIGPPDMVWLVRGTEGSASQNYDGLVAIMREIVGEINKAADKEVLAVDTAQRMGAKVATCAVPKAKPPVSFSVALFNDVVVVSKGDQILDEVLALLSGTGSREPLAVKPRFKQAFAKLPAAEDQMLFFDMQAMVHTFKGIAKLAFSAMNEKGRIVTGDRPKCPTVTRLHREAIDAYKAKDYATALKRTQEAHELAPEAALHRYKLACFHALLGHKEEALGWLEKAVDAGFYSPGMIATDADLDSLRDDPRYKVALARASEDIDAAKRLVARLIALPGVIDYIASVEYTDGYSARSDTITALVPDAKDMPFYRVFGQREQLTDFARYLPQETVSFSLNGGIDLTTLYTFIEDTIRVAGSKGEEILAQWTGIQAQLGLDFAKDVLGWIDGKIVTVTVGQPGGDAKVFMLKVRDEAAARQKLASALEFLGTNLRQLAQQNPMLAMLAVQTSPSTNERLAGFHNVTVGIQPQPLVCGVTDGYLMIGTSAEATALCLATAAGEHPSVRKNAQLMSEAVVPKGAFSSISFTDKRGMGNDIKQILGALGMMGGMAMMAVPDPQAQQAITKATGILMKLGPVAQKIDFYKSSAQYTTFSGQEWRSYSVTNYQSPAERVAQGGR